MAFQYGMLMQLSMLLVLLLAATNAVAAATTRTSAREGGADDGKAGGLMAKPNCIAKCGNIEIPYPFGIGQGCYFGPRFEITCNGSNPRLMETVMLVTNISLEEGELQIRQLVNRDCYDALGNPIGEDQSRGGLSLIPPYTISGVKNWFFAVGCDTYALFVGRRGSQSYTTGTGCISVCKNNPTQYEHSFDKNESCSGIGCCKTNIPPLLNNLTLKVASYNNHTEVHDFNPCGFAFIVKMGHFKFSETSFQDLKKTYRLPLVLDWQIGEESCQNARQNKETFACKGNSTCHDKPSGYICRCKDGYQGNPYLEDSCRGTSLSLFVLLELARIPGSEKRTPRNFTEEEVKEATKEKVGEGGYGIVYKGLLDKKPVAIKKSKFSPPITRPVTATEPFVNELIVLSQINHKNVVRLVGCCFETRTPILVYEFIALGTLYDHIHRRNKKGLSLAKRLKIAAEAADALTYLHDSISPPIIHGDVKTTNILVDENYTAKVSDFGASRLVPEDENQISTLVQGTQGYLDPQYLQSNTFTDKSDVYSFGVVLAELLTSRKAVSLEKPEEERNLANAFVFKVESSLWDEILDQELVEGHLKTAELAADLAKRCLRVKGEERPPMKEVAAELQGLVRTMEQHPSGGEANISPPPKDTGNLVGSSASSASLVDIRGDGDGGDGADSSIIQITPLGDGR
ncbi:PREDICTED: wall-associated receptor kinase 2-like [Prunus mume]|uniref:Wall-associated receptor kinase 2-like n=1 Tax=Prunus mume TaxID=102107 RepID=A0ABM0NJA5_PRUMU|nr:PREDICTED: wall-associated receptor kinase 2-like [Prunus mume]